MKRKSTVVVLLLLAAVVIAAIGYGIYHFRTHDKENKMLPTDGKSFAVEEIATADPLIVGKWTNTSNPLWLRVFYDDYDDETGMFWGKEWDEKEDVFEEDLNYHGNGWFRWEKKKNSLRIYATMDARDVPIHRAYNILVSTSDSLVLQDTEYKKLIYRFAKSVDESSSVSL